MNTRGTTGYKIGFKNGMQKDISFSKYPKDSYFEAHNFSMYLNKEGSTFNIENVDGHLKKASIDVNVDIFNVLYAVETIDSILLFFQITTSKLFYIFRIKKDILTDNSSRKPVIEIGEYFTADSSSGVIYKESMSSLITVEFAKYNYESESVQKIYWKDDTGFRHLNIQNTNTNVLKDIEADSTYTYTTTLFEKAVFEDFIQGNLKNGAYFYTYQLYSVNGLESSFAPLSDVVYITDNFFTSDYKKISGGDVGVTSSLGVYGSISNIDTSKFNRIRIVSVFYASKQSIPEIKIIAEKIICDTIYFSDVGTFIGTLSPEDIVFRNVILNPNTIADKDGYLFIGSIDKKDYFDLDEWVIENDPDNDGVYEDLDGNKFWEARAFSFGFDGTNFTQTLTDNTLSQVDISYTGSGAIYPYHSNNTTDLSIKHNCTYTGIQNLRDTHCHAYKRNEDGINEVDFGLNPNDSIFNGRYRYGAYGVNIECSFFTDSINLNGTIDKSEAAGDIVSPLKDGGFFNDYTNPSNTQYLAIPYDEVERYGIQFREESTGRLSYVKWIIDLRSPHPACFQNADEDSSIAIVRTWAKDSPTNVDLVLYLKFKIRNLPSGLSWRIVRVPKEVESDYSNKTVGLYSDIYKRTGQDAWYSLIYPRTGDWEERPYCSYTNDIGIFTSPEICLNSYLQNNIEKFNYDDLYITSFGFFGFPQTLEFEFDVSTWRFSGTNLLNWFTPPHKFFRSITTSVETLGTDFIKYLEAPIFTDGFMTDQTRISLIETSDIDTDHYYNNGVLGYNIYNPEWVECWSRGGRRLLISGKNYYGIRGIRSFSGDCSPFMLAIKQENFQSRYGGHSYTDRSYNIYNPVSNFTTNTDNIKVYGDHYFGIFEYLNGFPGNREHIPDPDWTSNAEEGFFGMNIWWYPTISRHNINYLGKELWRKLVNKKLPSNILLSEEAGVKTREFDNTVYTKTQEDEYYKYNDVYELNKASLEIAVSRPFDFNNDSSKLEITHSNYKIHKEYTDSWLKYINNHSIELKSEYGLLVNIFNFKGTLFFVQEKGFGKLYALERQNAINNTNSITIAKGAVLEGFQMLETNYGATNKKHCTQSDDYIYIYSSNRKSIILFDGNNSINLGEQLSMGSFIMSLDIQELIFDFNTYTLIIYYKEGASYKYLLYNEKLKIFMSTSDSAFVKHFHINNNLFLTYPNESEDAIDIYEYGKGSKGKFFGTPQDSYITFLINPTQTHPFIMEYIDFLIDVIDKGEYIQIADMDLGESSRIKGINALINSIEIFNSYQRTVISSPKRIKEEVKQTYRKLRFNDFRIQDSSDTRTPPDKFIDYFIKIKITFNNDNGFRLVLHDLISHFKPSYVI